MRPLCSLTLVGDASAAYAAQLPMYLPVFPFSKVRMYVRAYMHACMCVCFIHSQARHQDQRQAETRRCQAGCGQAEASCCQARRCQAGCYQAETSRCQAGCIQAEAHGYST